MEILRYDADNYCTGCDLDLHTFVWQSELLFSACLNSILAWALMSKQGPGAFLPTQLNEEGKQMSTGSHFPSIN